MSMLDRLNPRERVLVLGGGALLILLGLWVYVWQPLVAQRDAQSAAIARYQTLIDLARNAETPTGIAAAPADPTPLPARVARSAEAAGIPLARLDPDGPRLRITVAKADYAQLIEWLAQLEDSAGVRALAVEMSRQIEPGQVSLRLTIEDAR